jgi:hypothetical protein
MNFYKTHQNSFHHKEIPYFVIENDDYIITFLNSMSVLNTASSDYTERLLLVKFEEIMLPTLQIQRRILLFVFFNFKEVSPFKNVVESNFILT